METQLYTQRQEAKIAISSNMIEVDMCIFRDTLDFFMAKYKNELSSHLSSIEKINWLLRTRESEIYEVYRKLILCIPSKLHKCEMYKKVYSKYITSNK